MSSNEAKTNNIAILNEVLPLISALKLNAGQRWAPIYGSPEFVQNSQTTRAISYRCRDYSKKCHSKTVISPRHYTVLCRSKSYRTRHNSHYVAMVYRRPRTCENLRQYTKCVRELYDNLRMSLDAELWRDL